MMQDNTFDIAMSSVFPYLFFSCGITCGITGTPEIHLLIFLDAPKKVIE
jgi:hypothetical protein